MKDAFQQIAKQTGTFTILSYLFEKEEKEEKIVEVNITEIMEDTGINQDPLYRSIELLESQGLISNSKENGPPPKRLITLTEDGRKIAEATVGLKRKILMLHR